MTRKLIALVLGLVACPVFAQQPQTQTDPLSRINAKYVNGVAPGYYPTSGSALTLDLGAGTANCSGTIAQYSGGTLTMAASTTNYVYLNTASSCVPAVKTTAFTSSDIPIAEVVTSGSAITSITDVRTPFATPGSGGSGASVGSAGQVQMVGATSGSFAPSAMTDNGSVVNSTEQINAPAFGGTGSNGFFNLPNNTSHSPSSGDLWNDGGVLDFNDGTATGCIPTQLGTSGTSGAASLNCTTGVLNIPVYGGGGGGGNFSPYPATLTPPLSSGFTASGLSLTLHNQSTRMVIVPAISTALPAGLLVSTTSLPSPPYTVDVAIGMASTPNGGSNQNPLSGILLSDSGGALIYFYFGQSSSTAVSVLAQYWTSSTSFGSTMASSSATSMQQGLFFLRITDDATNRVYWFSTNGRDYYEFFSEADTAHFTPTLVGIVVETNQSGNAPIFSVYNYVVTNSVLSNIGS